MIQPAPLTILRINDISSFSDAMINANVNTHTTVGNQIEVDGFVKYRNGPD